LANINETVGRIRSRLFKMYRLSPDSSPGIRFL